MRNINKGKIKRAALLLLAALSFVSHACTSGQGPSSETEPAEVTVANPEELVAEVKITVDKEKIPSSGAGDIYNGGGPMRTAMSSMALNLSILLKANRSSRYVFTNVPGFYNLYAYDDIRSNVIEVQVFDSDVARVALCRHDRRGWGTGQYRYKRI